MSPTKIEWVRNADGTPGETWNPTVGCSPAGGPGCDHCYAVTVVQRQMQDAHKGLTANGEWTGEIRVLPDRLSVPLERKKPTTWFVGSLSDLFHRDVPLDFFAQVWDVMVNTPQHTYLLLTKRPHRIAKVLGPRGIGAYAVEGPVPCPQPNIRIGTSVENQEVAQRITQLLGAPNALPWLSIEPLLGPVTLNPWIVRDEVHVWGQVKVARIITQSPIGWVVVGGESGLGARPMHPEWPIALRDQCAEASIPFLFKQWGAWGPNTVLNAAVHEDDRGHLRATNKGCWVEPDGTHRPLDTALVSPDSRLMRRVGKKAAGRALDGVVHDEIPGVAA